MGRGGEHGAHLKALPVYFAPLQARQEGMGGGLERAQLTVYVWGEEQGLVLPRLKALSVYLAPEREE